jgi:ribosomal protein S11
MAAEKAAKIATEHGMREIEVTVKGPGPAEKQLFDPCRQRGWK